MHIPGRKFALRLIRPFAHTVRPGGIILGYHRIADETWDPLGLCVSRDNFRQQLEVLRRYYKLVSLRVLVEKLSNGESVTNMAALTFDDGYRDFIDHAIPELERLEIPATVFISTGFFGNRFWWSDVAAALDPAASSHTSMRLRWNGAKSDRVYRGLDNRRRALAVARDLCRELSFLSEAARDKIVMQLTQSMPATTIQRAESARAMTDAEVRTLAESTIVEIGSHAVSHALLERLGEADQVAEIAGSKRRLEAVCGAETVQGFSFPHGSISEISRRLLVDHGFAYACTSREAVIRSNADVYSLPRIWARNDGSPRFRRWLSMWRGLRG